LEVYLIIIIMQHDDNIDIDIDEDDKWIQEQNKILNIQSNHPREPLPFIKIHLCYIDCNNSIVEIKTEKHVFTNTTTTITEAEILRLIDSKKRLSNRLFTFSEMAVFHVDLEPEHINSFAPETTTFFKPIAMISDICLTNSIFIFHPLNCLFFIFKQKSSLKTGTSTKSMKKVVFNPKKQTRRIT
jgi:hypothetical protein